MKIDKVKDSYNAYKAELSFGELKAIIAALQKDHADPVSDELLAGFLWYLESDKLPLPGEDKEDLKKIEKAKKDAEEANAEVGGAGLDELPPPSVEGVTDIPASDDPGFDAPIDDQLPEPTEA